MVRVVLTAALGYVCAVPASRGGWALDRAWGAAGLTASAGVAGWVEFALLRRTLRARIGEAALPAPLLARLWLSALLAAAGGWALKLVLGPRHPLVAGLLVLSLYGVIYLSMTLALGIPHARQLVRRIARR